MSQTMKTILFVCIHNAGRSQMAEALFNRAAGGKAMALSAGTKPSAAVNPVVVAAMNEVGIDIGGHKPKALTFEMVEQADRMITMGCGDDTEGVCPAGFIETEDWALEDPKGKSLAVVRKIRDEIQTRVHELIEQLGQGKTASRE